MRKALLGLLGLCGYSICSVGQVGLYLTAGTDISISATTVFSVDGLVLEPSSAFSINSPNSLTRDATIVHTAPQQHILRVFHFGNLSNSYTGNVGFYYADSERNGIAESALTLNTHSGSIWQYFAPVSRDAVNNVVYTNNIPGITFSELTLADMLSPLPLSWGPISAKRKPQGAEIKWHTTNEQVVAYFQVERSSDAIHWKPTANTLVPYNTPGQHQYKLLDATVPATQTFYRIKQVAINGRFTYSSIVAVEPLKIDSEVQVFPNPTTGWVTMQAGSQLVTQLKLYDANGRLLRHEKISNAKTYSWNLTGLPKGTYRIEVQLSNGSTSTHPIVKQ